MSYTIIRPADRMGWLAQREKGVGSSEVGTILGVNPFETPYQLWRRKRGLTPRKEENDAMRAGHFLEGAVAAYFEAESGRQVIKASEGDWLAVDDDKEYLRVSPDRTYWLSRWHYKHNKGILECKTTQLDIDRNNVPQHWFCQLTYQLGVMGMSQGSLAWLTRGRKFDYIDVQFNPDFYAYIIDRIEQFWKDCIVGGQEPPIASVDDALLKYPHSETGKAVEMTDELSEKLNMLKMLKPQIDELTRQKKELEDAIKVFMQDADSLCLPGTAEQNPIVVATYKSAKDSMKFDEKRFGQEHPDLYDNYLMKVAGSRRFVVKQ